MRLPHAGMLICCSVYRSDSYRLESFQWEEPVQSIKSDKWLSSATNTRCFRDPVTVPQHSPNISSDSW